jgi:hypothetical protein
MNTKIYEQTLKDLVLVETKGDISWLTFAWQSRHSGEPLSFFAPTKDVNKIVGKKKGVLDSRAVDKLASLPQFHAFKMEHPNLIEDESVQENLYPSWKDMYDKLYLPDQEAWDNIESHTLGRFDGSSLILRGFPDDKLIDQLVRVEYIAGPTAESFELDKLKSLLEENPKVKTITFDHGRTGAFDHIPAGYDISISMSAKELEQIKKHFTYLSPHDIGNALFWSAKYQKDFGLGIDPLGLKSAVRTEEYHYPEMEQDW